MREYLDLLAAVRITGEYRMDRTGTGCYSKFGTRMEFDLQKGFPLVTTKKVHLRGIITELLWFLRGDTNVKFLHDHGVTIWDEWADDSGDLGPIYGHQWRSWGTPDGGSIDQITNLIDGLKKDPFGRRHIVSAWNVGELGEMALPPCHCLFQFFVHHDLVLDRKVLSCQLYQRSADLFLGVPYNIASYALLTKMVAQVCDMLPGKFIWVGGDTHIYDNHLKQVDTQLSRRPTKLPELSISPEIKDIFGFTIDDFKLDGYDPHPAIQAPVAV